MWTPTVNIASRVRYLACHYADFRFLHAVLLQPLLRSYLPALCVPLPFVLTLSMCSFSQCPANHAVRDHVRE